MVRSGIITYGLYPSEEVSKDVLDLRPAMELKTHIVYIKEVEAGEGISYNHTYVTDKKTKDRNYPSRICRRIPKITLFQRKSIDPWAVCTDHWKNLYGSVYG